jgi:hypothetical protein
MNAFYEHHKNNIRFHYRCFDRILLNGTIQPFQQEQRVVGFFTEYRNLYPVSRDVLRDIATQFHNWVKNRSQKWDTHAHNPPRNLYRWTIHILSAVTQERRLAIHAWPISLRKSPRRSNLTISIVNPSASGGIDLSDLSNRRLPQNRGKRSRCRYRSRYPKVTASDLPMIHAGCLMVRRVNDCAPSWSLPPMAVCVTPTDSRSSPAIPAHERQLRGAPRP